MNQRRQFFQAFATQHPRSYWIMQSAVFYGLVSLFYDVTSTFGWGTSNHWMPRLLSAIFYGGYMLMVARRDVPQLPPADPRPEV
jgi:hypothetical protein